MPARTTRLRHPPGRPMETSSTLLRRVRDSGDAESWRELAALYGPLIVRYALGRGRGLSEQDALDVAQDVFARLVKAPPGFEPDRARCRFLPAGRMAPVPRAVGFVRGFRDPPDRPADRPPGPALPEPGRTKPVAGSIGDVPARGV